MSAATSVSAAQSVIQSLSHEIEFFQRQSKLTISEKLEKIRERIENLDRGNALESKTLLEATQLIFPLDSLTDDIDEKDRLMQLIIQMHNGVIGLLLSARTAQNSSENKFQVEVNYDRSISQSAKNKPVSQRIKEHNEKALKSLPDSNSLPIETRTFPRYPFTKEKKKRAEELRMLLTSMKSFSSSKINFPGMMRNGIFFKKKDMNSCLAYISCAQGNKPHMEDRFLAAPFTFQANGHMISADLLGIFDGHMTTEIVDYTKVHLKDRLQEKLQQRLISCDPNDDAIFFALKEAISSIHEECISKRLKGGTTAVIGFKLADSNELWTACVGDSSAYLNRNGTPVPMSIEQKPVYSSKESDVTFDKPNEYARQLMKKGVVPTMDSSASMEAEVRARKKMYMTFVNSIGHSHNMVLGIANKFHLDMARSVGDPFFAKYTKSTPEIFKQALQPGDQLILHSDGIKVTPWAVAQAMQHDFAMGCGLDETVKCLVQYSVCFGDNVSAMIVAFNISTKDQFLWDLVNGKDPDQLKSSFEQLEKMDVTFFNLLCAKVLSTDHEIWEKSGRKGEEPRGDDYGKNKMLHLLESPKNKDLILNLFYLLS